MTFERHLFVGGPLDGQTLPVGSGTARFRAPKHLRRSVFDWQNTVAPFETVEYVRASRQFEDGAGVRGTEVVFIEERLYRAELEAQQSGERRDARSAEMLRHFGTLPDLRALHSQPYLVARVWGCGDICECSQAELVGWTRAYTLDGEAVEPDAEGNFGQLVLQHAEDPLTHRRLGSYVSLWKGVFRSDGWGAGSAREDLLVLRRYLREFVPELERQIRWRR